METGCVVGKKDLMIKWSAVDVFWMLFAMKSVDLCGYFTWFNDEKLRMFPVGSSWSWRCGIIMIILRLKECEESPRTIQTALKKIHTGNDWHRELERSTMFNGKIGKVMISMAIFTFSMSQTVSNYQRIISWRSLLSMLWKLHGGSGASHCTISRICPIETFARTWGLGFTGFHDHPRAGWWTSHGKYGMKWNGYLELYP